MKKYLILGSSGTIGNAITKRLRSEGNWVRGVDIKYCDFNTSYADEFILSDLRDINNVRKAFHLPGERFDVVIALCAKMGGAEMVFSKKFDSQIIFDSAQLNINIAKVASEIGCGKILFSSSACMYGQNLQTETNSVSLKESMAWNEGGRPDSVYGVEKLFAEDVYDSFRRNDGLNVRICRFHNVFATHAVYKGGLEKFPAACCRKVAECPDGGEIEIFGDGLQTRSFLWVDEALTGVFKLLDSDYHQPINIGSDESISINDLAKMVIKFSGKNITIKNVPSDVVGVRGRNSDNTLIEKTLGWKPTQKLEIGMKKLYDWIDTEVNPKK